jgi:hypothetical protein
LLPRPGAVSFKRLLGRALRDLPINRELETKAEPSRLPNKGWWEMVALYRDPTVTDPEVDRKVQPKPLHAGTTSQAPNFGGMFVEESLSIPNLFREVRPGCTADPDGYTGRFVLGASGTSGRMDPVSTAVQSFDRELS